MDNNRNASGTIIGLAAVGSAVIGVVSFIAAFFPFLNGDFLSAGIFMIAAALSFGFLANAVFRT
jgi:hypothetical protein